VDETKDYKEGVEDATNGSDLWPMIVADFTFAWDNLPETQVRRTR
jgi:hypothetical protein